MVRVQMQSRCIVCKNIFDVIDSTIFCSRKCELVYLDGLRGKQ